MGNKVKQGVKTEFKVSPMNSTRKEDPEPISKNNASSKKKLQNDDDSEDYGSDAFEEVDYEEEDKSFHAPPKAFVKPLDLDSI